jgi:hypothetical protein
MDSGVGRLFRANIRAGTCANCPIFRMFLPILIGDTRSGISRFVQRKGPDRFPS